MFIQHPRLVATCLLGLGGMGVGAAITTDILEIREHNRSLVEAKTSHELAEEAANREHERKMALMQSAQEHEKYMLLKRSWW